jgi:hypothetical protein
MQSGTRQTAVKVVGMAKGKIQRVLRKGHFGATRVFCGGEFGFDFNLQLLQIAPLLWS